MIYKWLISLLKDMNAYAAISNFLWTHSTIKRELITMAWRKHCVPRAEGRFRIKNNVVLNRA